VFSGTESRCNFPSASQFTASKILRKNFQENVYDLRGGGWMEKDGKAKTQNHISEIRE
jgi:hypothetical protein